MAGLGLPELGVILVIVLVLFGGGRISKMMGEIGSGIREFRRGVSDEDKKKEIVAETTTTTTNIQ